MVMTIGRAGPHQKAGWSLPRPPIGPVWGWAEAVAGRAATDSLLAGGALVLSPHFDDETIGCGLLIAEKARRGIPVAVAVATDGRHGWYSPRPRPAQHEIAAIRHREWHRALDILAVPRAGRFEMGFPDGELGDHESEVVDRIADLLRSVRPSQVFVTRLVCSHFDHYVLARAARKAVNQTHDHGLGVPHGEASDGSGAYSLSPRPQVFTYRVYPGEGLWPYGRPSRVTAVAAVGQLARSILSLTGQRPLLFRASGSMSTKVAAINAYESQCKLLESDVRYVWDTSVELYWPMDGHGLVNALPASELDLKQPPTTTG